MGNLSINKKDVIRGKRYHALLTGDSLAVLKGLEDDMADLVITSPPYNTSRVSGSIEDHMDRYVDFRDDMPNEDYVKWTCNMFDELEKKIKVNGTIIYNISYGSENPEAMWLAIAGIMRETNFTVADHITWKKSSALPNNTSPNKLTRITESVFVFVRKDEYKTYKSNKKVKSVSKKGQNYYHNATNFIEAKNNDGATKFNKATYSSELVVKLLDLYGTDGGLVLDPFSGTGTTSVGADLWGMNSIGIELSKEQVDYAKVRISKLNKDQ